MCCFDHDCHLLIVPTTSLRVPLLLRRKASRTASSTTSYPTIMSRNETSSDYQMQSASDLKTNYHDASQGGYAGVKLRRRGDAVLLGEIMVGTPPTKYLVDFDTGSSVVWLFGEKTKNMLRVMLEFATYGADDDEDVDEDGEDASDTHDGNNFVHTFYNKEASKSYKPWYSEDRISPLPMKAAYGDGDIFTGEFANETLYVGNNLRLENAALGITNHIVSCRTGITEYDGIFGLGIQPHNNPGITPPFIQMVNGKLFGENKFFSLYLSSDGHHGEILFGEVNKQLFSGPLNYAPRARYLEEDRQPARWTLGLSRATFGEYTYNRRSSVLIDSGASGINVPRNFLKSILKYFNQHHSSSVLLREGWVYYYEFDGCDKVVRTLPDLIFAIHGGKRYRLRATEYFSIEEGYCELLLQARGYPFWVFGEPFLRKYYTVFDYGNDRIGFAPANHVVTEKEGDSR